MSPGRASALPRTVAIVLALLVAAAAWRAWRAGPPPAQAVVAPVVATPADAPVASKAPSQPPSTLASPDHVASRERADAALLEISLQAERDLIRGDTLDAPRARAVTSDEEFFALIDGFALQSQHDDGKAEIGRLLADRVARGFRRLHSDARIERLSCGLRLCAAHVRAPRADAEIDLPFPLVRVAAAHLDGGVDIRIVFAIDPAIAGLHRQAPLQ
jgi:hypothetical protein